MSCYITKSIQLFDWKNNKDFKKYLDLNFINLVTVSKFFTHKSDKILRCVFKQAPVMGCLTWKRIIEIYKNIHQVWRLHVAHLQII